MTKIEKKSKDQQARLANTRRNNLGWFFGFLIVFFLLDIFLFPYILNWLLSKTPGYTDLVYELTKLETDRFLLLNWSWCFSPIRIGGMSRMIMTIALQLVFIAFLIKIYFGTHKGNLSAGVEHGSARMITDEEFDQLIPATFFGKNEQENYKDPETMPILKDESYSPNLFDTFEYEDE